MRHFRKRCAMAHARIVPMLRSRVYFSIDHGAIQPRVGAVAMTESHV